MAHIHACRLILIHIKEMNLRELCVVEGDTCHMCALEARRMSQIPLELLIEVALSHLT